MHEEHRSPRGLALLRAAIAAATLVPLSVLAVACTPGHDPPDALAAGAGATSAPLVETGPMPPEPPRVLTQGLELEPMVTNWIVDDQVVTTGAQADADVQAIDVAVVPHTDQLSLTIGHPTVPPTLYVEVFEELDARNHPVGPGRHIDCTPGGSECWVNRRGDALEVGLGLEAGQHLVVLQVAYTVWPEVRERVDGAPALLTASWAVVVSE